MAAATPVVSPASSFPAFRRAMSAAITSPGVIWRWYLNLQSGLRGVPSSAGGRTGESLESRSSSALVLPIMAFGASSEALRDRTARMETAHVHGCGCAIDDIRRDLADYLLNAGRRIPTVDAPQVSAILDAAFGPDAEVLSESAGFAYVPARER